MLILTIRTDNPEAEIRLYDTGKLLEVYSWQAHRLLAETIHDKINQLLARHGKSLHDVQGVACFQGPGSFTGLRIGLSVGNAFAYALEIPIVAAIDQDGRDWYEIALSRLQAGETDPLAMPEYGSDVHITPPRQ